MFDFLNRINTLLKFPGQYFRYRKEPSRKFYYFISKFLHFRTRRARKPENFFDYSGLNADFFLKNHLGFKFYDKDVLERNDLKVEKLTNFINEKIIANNKMTGHNQGWFHSA